MDTFIIAEVGSNYRNIEDCYASIEKAARCGANAVKFQLFTYEDFYGVKHPEWDIERGVLPRNWVQKLKHKCIDNNIEFMCTPFSARGAQFLRSYVDRYKVASSNAADLHLLKELNAIGKPIILSTGGHTYAEIREILKVITVPVTLLYCVPEYPAERVDLRHIEHMREFLDRSVGYSDHTTDPYYIPWSAVHNHGASVLEKHVNLVDLEEGPDVPHSLDEARFESMIVHLRNGLGPHMKSYTQFRSEHIARPVSTQKIEPGQPLKGKFKYLRRQMPSP